MVRVRRNPIIALSIGHACVDVYQGSVAALVPLFVLERHYVYAAASGIVTAASLLSSVAQPIFGALRDRWPMRWLLPLSMSISGLGIAVSGVAPSYPLTLACFGLAGMAIAAYHPVSAQLARASSGGRHRAMSWFSLGGNLGFTAAPLLTSILSALGGLHLSPLLFAPAAIGVLTTLPVLASSRAARPAPTHPVSPTPRHQDWRSFGQLTIAVAARSVIFVGLSTFIASYARERIGGTMAGPAALLALYAGGAIGTVLGGVLAERWPRIVITRWAYGAAALAAAMTLAVPGLLLYPFVVLTAIGLYVPFSLQVTLAQDYLPRNSGTASGVTLGLAITVGGLFSPVLGSIADHSTLRTALIPLIGMPIVAWVALQRVPEPPSTAAH